MTPTQQTLADIRARGREVWERASMVEMQDWRMSLSAAQVDAWQCGECCGARSSGGDLCMSQMVRIARHAKLQANGMGRDSARAMSDVCEHSDKYADIQAAYRLAKDMAPDGVRLADVVMAVDSVERDLDGNGND